jgi:branched-chain amino acid aminotransferase
VSAGALEGITQWSVIKILEDLGYEVEKGNIARSDLYIAEEIFCVGTAAEVSAINSVDDREVPCPGPITLQVADIYGKAVRGQLPQYKDWLELA